MQRKTHIKDGIITNQVIYDPTETLKDNANARNSRSSIQKYKGNLSHVAKIDLGFIEQMANGQCCTNGVKYNLMSRDMDERRRALLHIQQEHKHWLSVDGTPFAKSRTKWQ